MPMPDQLPAAIPPHCSSTSAPGCQRDGPSAPVSWALRRMDVTSARMLAFAVLMDPAGATFAVLQPIGRCPGTRTPDVRPQARLLNADTIAFTVLEERDPADHIAHELLRLEDRAAGFGYARENAVDVAAAAQVDGGAVVGWACRRDTGRRSRWALRPSAWIRSRPRIVRSGHECDLLLRDVAVELDARSMSVTGCPPKRSCRPCDPPEWSGFGGMYVPELVVAASAPVRLGS